MQRLLEKISFTILRLPSDNRIEFTYKYVTNIDEPREHALDRLCGELGIRHVLIPPSEKELQGLVERKHRQDDNELYHRIRPLTLTDLNRELEKYTVWCNSRCRRKVLGWKAFAQYLAD